MIIFFQQTNVFRLISKDLHELRISLLVGLHKVGQRGIQFFHRMNRRIIKPTLLSPALRFRLMQSGHETMCTRLHLQPRQRLEDFSSPIIEEHNTQIAPQMIAP